MHIEEKTGFVSASLLLGGGGGNDGLEIDAIVDTGFDGALLLPRSIYDAYVIEELSEEENTLADGTKYLTRLGYLLVRPWYSQHWLRVLCHGAPDDSVRRLIGLKLLGTRYAIEREEREARVHADVYGVVDDDEVFLIDS